MSEDHLASICCSGKFPFVPFFEPLLSKEQFRISTQKPSGTSEIVGCNLNYRVVQIPFCDDISRRVIAVCGFSSPWPVLVYDVRSKRRLSTCLGHRNAIFGLACIPSTVSSNPRIVSGDGCDTAVLVFDAIEGTELCQLLDPPAFTSRILHVPQWNHHEIFVAGEDWAATGSLYIYDLTKDRKIGTYEDGELEDVRGLSADISHNLLVSCSLDRSVRLWSRDSCCCQKVVEVVDSADSVFWVEGKNLFVVGLRKGLIQVFDVRRSDASIQVVAPVSPGQMVRDFAGIDANRVIVGSGITRTGGTKQANGTLAIFNLNSGKLGKKQEFADPICGVCVLAGQEGLSQRKDEEERFAFAEELLVSHPSFSVEVRLCFLKLRCFGFLRCHNRPEDINF